jgi:hypothetical protein
MGDYDFLVSIMQLFFLIRCSVFSSARAVFSSSGGADENIYSIFVGRMGRWKYVAQFRRPRWPTKIVLFSSVANENAFIFVNFILSAYFRQPTDKNTYFWWFLGYFRRFVADEITLFSCSVWTLGGQWCVLSPCDQAGPRAYWHALWFKEVFRSRN